MTVSLEDVSRVSKLAKLQFSEQEKESLSQDMSRIFGWIDSLNETNAESVSPLTSVSVEKMPLRQDVIQCADHQEEITQQSSGSQFNMFVVPKVIE